MRQYVATFANFVCRFGDDKVLLDYAKEIVLPAFFDDTYIRSYGKKAQFFFYEVEQVILNEDQHDPILGIAGRFIKNTYLTREQIFDPEKGIVADAASIQSSPSAYFLLILNNHRLIYFPETAHAPDLATFRVTVLDFIKRKHRAFLDHLYEDLNKEEKTVTKKQLIEMHPHPSLEIISISGDEQVESFIRRYGKLKKIQFRLITPNDEIDGAALFSAMREHLSPLNPNSAKIDVSSGKEGLDIEAAITVVKEATKTANHEVRLTGFDQQGNILNGDNHEFRIETEIEPVPPTRKGLVERLFGAFTELVSGGSIKIGNHVDDISQKIRGLIG